MIKKLNIYSIIKFVIQLAFFISMPALYSAAFSGIKYIAIQIHSQEMIVWNPFLSTLAVLLVSTIIFGRFFCGFACSFGSVGDLLFTCSTLIQKKFRKKIFILPDSAIKYLNYLKYVVLIGIIALCLTGTYSYISQADPWEIFASFRAGNFAINGRYIALAILIAIVIGMCLVERFFCQFLCPMGAVFALMPSLPFLIFNREKKDCIPGCTICIKTCPASISLGEKHSRYNDCFQCGKCSVKCPKKNMRLGIRKLLGTEVWLTAGKAVILLVVCWPLMN